MIRSSHLVVVSSFVLFACARQAPVTASPLPEQRVTPKEGVLTPGRAHIAYQFNNETVIIQDADGPGAGAVLYHGQQLTPDQIKTVKVSCAGIEEDQLPKCAQAKGHLLRGAIFY